MRLSGNLETVTGGAIGNHYGTHAGHSWDDCALTAAGGWVTTMTVPAANDSTATVAVESTTVMAHDPNSYVPAPLTPGPGASPNFRRFETPAAGVSFGAPSVGENLPIAGGSDWATGDGIVVEHCSNSLITRQPSYNNQQHFTTHMSQYAPLEVTAPSRSLPVSPLHPIPINPTPPQHLQLHSPLQPSPQQQQPLPSPTSHLHQHHAESLPQALDPRQDKYQVGDEHVACGQHAAATSPANTTLPHRHITHPASPHHRLRHHHHHHHHFPLNHQHKPLPPHSLLVAANTAWLRGAHCYAVHTAIQFIMSQASKGKNDFGSVEEAHRLLAAMAKQVALGKVVIAVNRSNVDDLLSVGTALRALSKYEPSAVTPMAVACLRDAVALRPSLAWAWAELGEVMQSAGNYLDARYCYSVAVKQAPLAARFWCLLARVTHLSGQPSCALSLYLEASRLAPNDAQSYWAMGDLYQEAGSLDHAVGMYQLASSLQPKDAVGLAKAAALYAKMGRIDECVSTYERVLDLDPGLVEAGMHLAVILETVGRACEAIVAYRRCGGMPGTDQMMVLQALTRIVGSSPVLLAAANGAVETHQRYGGGGGDGHWLRGGTAEAYNQLGILQRDNSAYGPALDLFRTAVDIHPDSTDALSNLVHLLQFISAWRGWRELFSRLRALLHRQLLDPSARLSVQPFHVLCYPLDPAEAKAVSIRFAARAAAVADALRAADPSLWFTHSPANARASYLAAEEVLPQALGEEKLLLSVSGGDLGNNSNNVPLPKVADIGAVVASVCVAGAGPAADAALAVDGRRRAVWWTWGRCSTSTLGSNGLSLQGVHHQQQGKKVPAAAMAVEGARGNSLLGEGGRVGGASRRQKVFPVFARRLRLGYVSSDFGNHPLSHLMQSVFGMHDRSRVQVFCYALSSPDGSEWRQTVEMGADVFTDVSMLDDAAVARKIHGDAIDVLINLNGYTKGARTEIFALRPAPVQMLYMGFPGTMGASYIDYLVTDMVTSPKQYESCYAEKLLRMPTYYFVNDHRQSFPAVAGLPSIKKGKDELPPVTPDSKKSSQAPSPSHNHTSGDVSAGLSADHRAAQRAALGLPERGFVFCNFCQLYKLDAPTLDAWCRILLRCEGSVLWLLRFPHQAEANVHREAQARGVSSARIVFTDVACKEEYMKRARLADLCLDTPMCNGHTTSCDVLWAGVPVLALPQRVMASRVSASLVTALGLGDELVVDSLSTYEKKAVALARNPARMTALRRRVEKARLDSPLFDTRRWVTEFETCCEAVFCRYVEGKLPTNVTVVREDNNSLNHDVSGDEDLQRDGYVRVTDQKDGGSNNDDILCRQGHVQRASMASYRVEYEDDCEEDEQCVDGQQILQHAPTNLSPSSSPSPHSTTSDLTLGREGERQQTPAVQQAGASPTLLPGALAVVDQKADADGGSRGASGYKGREAMHNRRADDESSSCTPGPARRRRRRRRATAGQSKAMDSFPGTSRRPRSAVRAAASEMGPAWEGAARTSAMARKEGVMIARAGPSATRQEETYASLAVETMADALTTSDTIQNVDVQSSAAIATASTAAAAAAAAAAATAAAVMAAGATTAAMVTHSLDAVGVAATATSLLPMTAATSARAATDVIENVEQPKAPAFVGCVGVAPSSCNDQPPAPLSLALSSCLQDSHPHHLPPPPSLNKPQNDATVLPAAVTTPSLPMSTTISAMGPNLLLDGCSPPMTQITHHNPTLAPAPPNPPPPPSHVDVLPGGGAAEGVVVMGGGSPPQPEAGGDGGFVSGAYGAVSAGPPLNNFVVSAVGANLHSQPCGVVFCPPPPPPAVPQPSPPLTVPYSFSGPTTTGVVPPMPLNPPAGGVNLQQQVGSLAAGIPSHVPPVEPLHAAVYSCASNKSTGQPPTLLPLLDTMQLHHRPCVAEAPNPQQSAVVDNDAHMMEACCVDEAIGTRNAAPHSAILVAPPSPSLSPQPPPPPHPSSQPLHPSPTPPCPARQASSIDDANIMLANSPFIDDEIDALDLGVM